MLVLNAFSLSMLPLSADLGSVHFNRISQEQAAATAQSKGVQSAVGHADTARLFSELLGVDVEMNRTSVQLFHADVAIVGQYKGPRLPEGATELPEGAVVEWFQISVSDWSQEVGTDAA